MFCTKCGIKIDADSKFCKSCGDPVSAPVTENVEAWQQYQATAKKKPILLHIFLGALIVTGLATGTFLVFQDSAADDLNYESTNYYQYSVTDDLGYEPYGNYQAIIVGQEPTPGVLETLTACSGCGDERMHTSASLDSNFEGNAVVIVLTRCVIQRDNRDWTLDDFGNVPGAIYISDLDRLSDSEWESIQAGRWREETLVNWPEYRRIMLIRLDQTCKQNVLDVARWLLEQHDFVRIAEPNYVFEPE
jgi:hypothetical protein